MTKDVLLSISGLHYDVAGNFSTRARGFFFATDRKSVV